MNPIRNNMGFNPQVMNGIKQAKGLMSMAKGNPGAFMQQMNNPMINQIMQMCKGQNPEQVFRAMCQAQGIDAEQFIKELQV